MADDLGSSVGSGATAGAAIGTAVSPGIGTVVGGVAGGAIGLLGGLYSNAASARQARIQRDWQEMMSSTAHQREVADLKAAGLNPILSATGGSGSSTPGGAMATVVNPVDAAARGMSSGIEAANAREARRNLMADTNVKDTAGDLNEATRNRQKQDTNTSKASEILLEEQKDTQRHNTATAKENARKARVEADVAEAEKPVLLNKAALAAQITRIEQQGGDVLKKLWDYFMPALESAKKNVIPKR